jgi:hypothetical protein
MTRTPAQHVDYLLQQECKNSRHSFTRGCWCVWCMLTGPEDAFGREPIEKKKHRRVRDDENKLQTLFLIVFLLVLVGRKFWSESQSVPFRIMTSLFRVNGDDATQKIQDTKTKKALDEVSRSCTIRDPKCHHHSLILFIHASH